MIDPRRLRGLYVITDPDLCGQHLLDKVAAAIAGGARLVQYRNKQASAAQQQKEAHALRELCRQNQVLFLVNDDANLARKVEADGVHLGQRDTGPGEARALLGEDAIIGISCNNRYEHALAAQQAGADYIAFGRFFPSRTKPQAPRAEPALLEQARRELPVPVCAIGGIRPEHIPGLRAAGADMVAVIHGIFGAANVRAAARRYVAQFDG